MALLSVIIPIKDEQDNILALHEKIVKSDFKNTDAGNFNKTKLCDL